jgi:heme-degrading monooxygenase HmoA
MLQIIWEYHVRPEQVAAFERYYGPQGDWSQFFRQGAGYLGTILLRDAEHADHYVTIDQWDSVEDFQRFKEQHAAGYKRHDAHCEQFTLDERMVGQFEVAGS